MTVSAFGAKVALTTLINVIALLAAPLIVARLLRYDNRKTWLWALGLTIPLGLLIFQLFAKKPDKEEV